MNRNCRQHGWRAPCAGRPDSVPTQAPRPLLGRAGITPFPVKGGGIHPPVKSGVGTVWP